MNRYGEGVVEVVNGWHVEKLHRNEFSYAVDSPWTGYGDKFYSQAKALAFACANDPKKIPARK